MLFSLDRRSKKRGSADEIRCEYNQLALILPFVAGKRVLITGITKDADSSIIAEQAYALIEAGADYTIQCSDIPTLRRLLDQGHNAFIRFPVNDWETFIDLLRLRVSDIYIDGCIAFSADRVKTVKGVTKIRVSPTFSTNSLFSSERVSSFFIRPEDLHLYEDVIDIIDFQEPDLEKEEILFDIYKIQKTTILPLDSFIKKTPSGILNIMVEEDFGEKRLNCGQACRIPGRSCHYCDLALKHAQLLSRLLKEEGEKNAVDSNLI